MAIVQIPVLLRPYTHQEAKVLISSPTLKGLIDELVIIYPELAKHLFDTQKNIKPFANFYLNGHDIRFLNQAETVLNDNDTLTIILALAGG